MFWLGANNKPGTCIGDSCFPFVSVGNCVQHLAEVADPSMKTGSGTMQTSQKHSSSYQHALAVSTKSNTRDIASASCAYGAIAKSKRSSGREAPYDAAARGQHADQTMPPESETDNLREDAMCVACERKEKRILCTHV